MAQPAKIKLNKDQVNLIRGTLHGSLSRDMILGSYMVAYAVQVQHYTNAQVSAFLSIIPFLVLVRHWFLDPIREKPRITVLHWARFIQIGCLLAILMFFGREMPLIALIIIGVVFFIGNEFLQNAVWMNFVTEITVKTNRGYFLGQLRKFKQLTNMLFAVVGFFIVGDELSQSEHAVLLIIAILLLMNSSFWYKKIAPVPPPPNDQDFKVRGQVFHIIKTHPLLRKPLLIAVINAFLTWPAFIVYLIGTLNLPANLVMGSIIFSMFGSIVSEVFWGKRTDNFGVKNVFIWTYAGAIALLPILFFVPNYGDIATGSTAYWIGTICLLAYFFLKGVLDAGSMMASSIYRTEFLHINGGFQAINFLTAANQMVMSALIALGGLLFVAFRGSYIKQLGVVWVDPFRIVSLLVMFFSAIIGIIVIRRFRSQDGDA